MSHSLKRLLAGVLMAAIIATASVSSAGAVTSWSSTATRATKLVSATDLGRLAPSTPLHLAIGLALRNPAGLRALIRAVDTPGSSQYERFLSHSQYMARFAPTARAVAALTRYLAAQGFRHIAVAGDRLYVSADATAAQASRAFHTTLQRYAQRGEVVYANSTPAQVPAALAHTVLSVLGLNDIPGFQFPHQIKPLTSTGCGLLSYGLCSFNPQGFRDAYHAAGGTGAATAIAIMAEGDLTQVVKDLRTAEKAFGEPQVPYTIVHTGLASPDTSGADEWDLDTQYSSGMASTLSQLYIYDATTLTDSDIGLEFNRWVSDDKAKAASASFGECDVLPYADGFMLTNDEAMNVAAAQGQTMHASSGDTGGQSCAVAPTNGVPSPDGGVNYPCSSPYVVCVGGTTLFSNPPVNDYSREIGWTDGGGGISALESSPYWQKCVVPSNGGSNLQRGVPDIAMDADPNTGAVVYVDGAPLIVGGTSLSSPLALGSWAIMETAAGNHLGFASPLLYRLYPTTGCVNGVPVPQTSQLGTPTNDPSYPLHDIVLGTNVAYPNTPGWDYVTGLGTYDVAAVSRAVSAEK